MRIVVWNCAMGLHKKWERLMSLRPDIAIIPECADPTIIWARRKTAPECDAQWIGGNPNKGLGIFAFHGLSLHRDHRYEAQFKYFLPVNVSGPAQFSLLAVWAFNRTTSPPLSYAAATMAAIDHYEDFLAPMGVIVAGDFNNSTYWDRPGNPSNFAALASRFGRMGLTSAYHERGNVPLGAEPEATHFHMKGPREYHIDYCFLPRPWSAHNVEVGAREDWIGASDHAPLVVECAKNVAPAV